MNALEVLKEMRELLTEKRQWTKGAYSKTKNNKTTYCLIGAMFHITNPNYEVDETDNTETKIRKELINTVKEIYSNNMNTAELEEQEVESFNDHENTTHPMILTTLDTTIERLRNVPV